MAETMLFEPSDAKMTRHSKPTKVIHNRLKKKKGVLLTRRSNALIRITKRGAFSILGSIDDATSVIPNGAKRVGDLSLGF
jgi:hypothetical protein